jgi:hypothetical protein
MVPNQYTANLTATSPSGGPDVAAGVLSIPLNGPNAANIGSASIGIAGTFVGTVQFEASGDGGATWYGIEAIPVTPPNTAVDSATAPGLFQICVAALTNLRARCSAFTSGTIGVTINLSNAAFVA